MRRMGWAGIALAAAALALGGCGDDDSSDESDEPGVRGEVPAETIDVSLSNFKIDPDSIQVNDPGLVAFKVTNDGDTTHAFEIEGNGLEEETESLEPGDSETLTVELTDGTYELYCPVGNHEDMGMVGTLVVGDGGEASAGSTTSETGTATDDDEDSEGATGTTETDEDEGDDDDDASGGGSSSSY